MTLQDTHRWSSPSLGLFVLSCLAIAVLWVLFVGGTRVNEMIVGLGVLALSAAFLFRVGQMESLNLDLQPSDLLRCWRIPWYIVSGIWEISIVFVKDILGIQPAGSFYRFSGFKTSERDPRRVARRVLATAYTTTAPNFIIIGIDVAQSRMFFHQLERSEVPQMTKELGAQPGVKR